MKDTELDQRLHELAAQPVPAPPGNLIAAVLREIRLRKSRVSRIEWLAALLWVPKAAFAVLPLAAFIGVTTAVLAPISQSETMTARGLYLEVFSQNSPTLPSTYIASRL